MKRRFHLRFFLYLFLICCGLSAAGCRNQQAERPEEPPSAMSAKKSSASVAQNDQTTAGGTPPYSLKIIPESPKVRDCIVVNVESGSDDLIYRWEINGVLKPNEKEPQLCDQQVQRGDVITVTVSGEKGQRQESVRIGNTPPEIIRTAWKIEGGSYVIVPEARDFDGDNISFSYQWVINGAESVGDNNNSLPAKRIQQGDQIEVLVTPFDMESQGNVYRSKPASVGNTPPTFLSTAPASVTGKEYRYAVQAKDPNGDAILYRLEIAPAGMVINDKTGELRWTLPAGIAGRHQVRIVVEDSLGALATQTFFLDLKSP